MCSALRFCLSVYLSLSPCGMAVSPLAGSGLVVVSRLGVRMQDGGNADIADATAGIHSRVGFDMRPGLLGGEVVTCAVDLDGGGLIINDETDGKALFVHGRSSRAVPSLAGGHICSAHRHVGRVALAFPLAAPAGCGGPELLPGGPGHPYTRAQPCAVIVWEVCHGTGNL